MNARQITAATKILDGFPFKAVQAFMLACNWRWFNRDTLPTEQDLRDTANRLLLTSMHECDGKEEMVVGTGGFEASYDPSTDELKLVFKYESDSVNMEK